MYLGDHFCEKEKKNVTPNSKFQTFYYQKLGPIFVCPTLCIPIRKIQQFHLTKNLVRNSIT